MSNIPADLKYTHSHEWVRDNGNGTVTIGITDHAQAALGDIVFVELPETEHLDAEDACTVIESVKAASDVYCPMAGTVVEVNDDLEDAPETINSDAYGEGWIFTLQVDSSDDLADLLDATAYKAECDD
jgi:glycine cleavage system H protein